MRTIILCSLFFGSFTVSAQTKKPEPKFDINTFYICIDSGTYRNLFRDPFIKDSLFYCREATTQTTTDDYSGKYALGQTATLEFFSPAMTDQHGDHFGDAGVEFRTRRFGTLTGYASKARLQGIPVNADTSIIPGKKGNTKWYASLNSEHRPDPLSLMMLEYQPEYLRGLGFSAAEIRQSMSPVWFNNRLSKGKKFNRLFNVIRSVTLVVSPAERQLLRDFSDLYDLQLTDSTLSADGFQIRYTVTERPPVFRVRQVEIGLVRTSAEKDIMVSPNLRVRTSGKTATLEFNY